MNKLFPATFFFLDRTFLRQLSIVRPQLPTESTLWPAAGRGQRGREREDRDRRERKLLYFVVWFVERHNLILPNGNFALSQWYVVALSTLTDHYANFSITAYSLFMFYMRLVRICRPMDTTNCRCARKKRKKEKEADRGRESSIDAPGDDTSLPTTEYTRTFEINICF